MGAIAPGPPLQGAPPVMKFICFKLNIRLKNFRDSEMMHEYSSNLIFLCCFKYKGPPTETYFSTCLTVCQF